MQARLKHIAIVTPDPERSQLFYKSLFGMRPFREGDTSGAVSDGYLGLNFNLRAPGRQGSLDHFGFEVDDLDEVRSRIDRMYPAVELLQRPGSRPFAGISSHDPEGHVFDLSHRSMDNRKGIYTEAERKNTRHVRHLTMRTMDPAAMAKFYMDVVDLAWVREPDDYGAYYLSDGTIDFVICPWRISDFAGGGIERPNLDHIGFEVEDLQEFSEDFARFVEEHEEAAPLQRSEGRDSEAASRDALFKQCAYGEVHLCDPDGVLFDVAQASRG